ncbi:MAG: plastocyanin/azurin family copper-binding protein [Actinomycetota bacterium]|nr:hypothetical protein [Actinomycetota bacterium]
MKNRFKIFSAALALAMAAVPSAQAFHLYRGPGGGCTPADGATGDAATPASTVLMLHNTFNDTATGTPITRIHAGDAVKWTWNSVHCHSVLSDTGAFYSEFHYPTTEPTSPHVAPGLFDYPVLEENATLSWTHVFSTPGTFTYACEHHNVIGMHGVVIVE